MFEGTLWAWLGGFIKTCQVAFAFLVGVIPKEEADDAMPEPEDPYLKGADVASQRIWRGDVAQVARNLEIR